MSRRGRILVLTPRFPYPVVGGDRLRIHAICRALAQEFSLTLLSLCESEEDFEPSLVTDNVFDSIERVRLPRWRSLAQVLTALPGRTPLQVAYYRSRFLADRVAALLPQHDLALAHLIRTGDYLIGHHVVPVVLEMTDAISMNYARVREHGGAGLRGRIYAIEETRLRVYERSMAQTFGTVSLIADSDARYLWGAKQPDNVVVASNGVDCQELGYLDRVNNRSIGTFIGNLHSAQNMDACRHFVADILPMIPDADMEEFRVVGRIRPRDAAWLRAHRRVTVTGEISSIPEAVADARIGLCPVRLGAGVQNKVLEYMALGLPTVCSTVGHEGLLAVDGRDLLVAQTPSAFATRISQLATQPSLFRSIATNGRHFVETMHGWEAVLAPLIDRIRQQISTSLQSRTTSLAPSVMR